MTEIISGKEASFQVGHNIFFKMFFLQRQTRRQLHLIRSSQTLLDASHTADIQRNTGLARNLKALALQVVVRLQKAADSR